MLAVALFLALEAVAASRYPGGTFLDRESLGHSFFGNFLCELARETAVNGEPNPGALPGRLGMTVLLAGLVLFFSELGGRARTPGSVRLIRGAGAAACLVALPLPWLPPHLDRVLHQPLTLVAGALGLLAALLGLVALWRARARVPALLGALTFACGVVSSAVYLEFALTGHRPLLLPTTQKVATLALCGWMLAVSGARLLGRPR